MPSPVRHQQHSKPHSRIIGILFQYAAAMPGIDLGDNATVRLDLENEVQPDAFLRIEERFGGQSSISSDDFIEGAPELIVEIAASSAAYDLHEKLRVYRRNGVQEYLVLLAYEKETRWYRLVEGKYEQVMPNDAGILESQVFPGLCLQPDLFWQDKLAALLDILQEGLQGSAHADFVHKLTA